MFRRLGICAAILLATVSSVSPGAAQGPLSSEVNQQLVKATLRKLTLRQKIGQLFMIGFNGTDLNEGLAETITAVAPGGLIVFGRNITSARQISDLLYHAQLRAMQSTHVPLLVSTDQEGGTVIRLKTSSPLPSALAIGKTGDPGLAERAGLATAQLMHALGFNMNLAPVVDVADARRSSFIGSRSFGESADLVATMGGGFSQGLMRGGVLPTAKHFPGQGTLVQDPHNERAEKLLSLEEMLHGDLLPFAQLQKSFQEKFAVMVGHISCPEIDPSGDAAVYSKPIVTDVLRNSLGFNGVVLTDDIQMTGAGSLKDPRERALRAIEAGVDMIMVAWNRRLQRDLVNAVAHAVQTGRISMARIDESVQRILQAKLLYAASPPRAAGRSELRLAIENRAFADIASSTLLARFQKPLDADEKHLREMISATAEREPVLVFSTNQRFLTSFKSALDGHRRVLTSSIDFNRPDLVNRTMLEHPRAVGVFYISGKQAEQVAAKISTDVARRMLLVSVETPGSLPNAREFPYIADLYFRHTNVGSMVARRYFGDGAPLVEVRGPAAFKNARGE